MSPMPNVGECIVALFTDGAGEVTSVDGYYLEADFYAKAKVSQMGKNSSLWKRPLIGQRENHHIHKNSVLPIRPIFGVNKYSTHRVVIYELLNAELIAKLCYILTFLYFIVKRHKSFSKSFDRIILFERYY